MSSIRAALTDEARDLRARLVRIQGGKRTHRIPIPA
jgi:hypothetical protein